MNRIFPGDRRDDMPWNEGARHVLGLPEMDAQHDYLYSLFDRIGEQAFIANHGRMRALLDEIERYLSFHFDGEELLMRMYGYPGFSVHQSDHEQAGAKLVAFLGDFDAGGFNPAALRIFLTGWLMEHSRLSDAGYVSWINEKRGGL